MKYFKLTLCFGEAELNEISKPQMSIVYDLFEELNLMKKAHLDEMPTITYSVEHKSLNPKNAVYKRIGNVDMTDTQMLYIGVLNAVLNIDKRYSESKEFMDSLEFGLQVVSEELNMTVWISKSILLHGKVL